MPHLLWGTRAVDMWSKWSVLSVREQITPPKIVAQIWYVIFVDGMDTRLKPVAWRKQQLKVDSIQMFPREIKPLQIWLRERIWIFHSQPKNASKYLTCWKDLRPGRWLGRELNGRVSTILTKLKREDATKLKPLARIFGTNALNIPQLEPLSYSPFQISKIKSVMQTNVSFVL